MCQNWSLKEYVVARQLISAGCPLEIPRPPRGQPRLEVKAQPGTLNEIIDLGHCQTGYALELLIADNLPGEFFVEYADLVLPWETTPINWFEDPSEWKSFPDLRHIRRGYSELTHEDLLKLPCKMRRGKVLRSVLVGVSYNPIPGEFLSVPCVAAKVVLGNFWGEEHSGSVDLTVSESKAARLARQPVKQPIARQRRSILAKDPGTTLSLPKFAKLLSSPTRKTKIPPNNGKEFEHLRTMPGKGNGFRTKSVLVGLAHAEAAKPVNVDLRASTAYDGHNYRRERICRQEAR